MNARLKEQRCAAPIRGVQLCDAVLTGLLQSGEQRFEHVVHESDARSARHQYRAARVQRMNYTYRTTSAHTEQYSIPVRSRNLSTDLSADVTQSALWIVYGTEREAVGD